ncbi:MAG TPA: hypothetical protein VM870_09250 [Pyrinomonadaceae bacterium]|jgi:hypothetical protein|nr:hypothetical protein [Pyrinomonadaceae bacterium]
MRSAIKFLSGLILLAAANVCGQDGWLKGQKSDSGDYHCVMINGFSRSDPERLR